MITSVPTSQTETKSNIIRSQLDLDRLRVTQEVGGVSYVDIHTYTQEVIITQAVRGLLHVNIHTCTCTGSNYDTGC